MTPRIGNYLEKTKTLQAPGDSPEWVGTSALFHGAALYSPRTKSSINVIAGFFKRVSWFHPHDVTLRNNFEVFIRNEFMDYIRSYKVPYRRVSLDEYLKDRDEPATTKMRLRLFHEDFLVSPTSLDSRDKRVQLFIKNEWYEQCGKYPRLIMPMSERYRAVYGPVIKSVEKTIYDFPCIVKKVPLRDRPKRIRGTFGEGKLWVNDFSSFESSTTAWVIQNILLPVYLLLADGCDAQEINDYLDNLAAEKKYVYADLKFVGTGQRTSGDLDTSLGNCIWNMALILFYYHMNGHSIHTPFLVEGDDSIFQDVGNPRDFFTRLGVTGKPESKEHKNDTNFCKVYVCGKNVLGNAWPMVLKLGWVNRQYMSANERKLESLLLAKVMSYLCTYPGCPIIYPICLHIYNCLQHRMLTPIAPTDYWEREKFNQWDDEVLTILVDSNDRLLYQQNFEITVADQYRIEAELIRSYDCGEMRSPTLLNYVPASCVSSWEKNVEKIDVKNFKIVCQHKTSRDGLNVDYESIELAAQI